MARLTLPAAAAAAIEAAAGAGYPRERCGVLLGRRDDAGVSVRRFFPARNVEPDDPATRYVLDPADFLAAHAAARAAGDEVVGIWHSHPDRPARPSEADRVGAWEGWSYLITAVRAGRVGATRSWRLGPVGFEEEPVDEEARG